MSFEWERLIRIEDHDNVAWSETLRAKVYGGWIVWTTTGINPHRKDNEISISQSKVFIPDPNHQWVLN